LFVSPSSVDKTIGLRHIAKVEPLGLAIIGVVVSDHQVELQIMKHDIDLRNELQRF
jgi:hypothetical protein